MSDMIQMQRHKITLQARLTGITGAGRVVPASPPSSGPTPTLPEAAPAPPARPVASDPKPTAAQEAQDAASLQTFLAEWARLVQEMRTRDRHTFDEVAQMSVELGTAIAERLIGAEIAANRQRLDRIVLAALDRMQAARSIVARGHPDDLALLERQIAEHAELERYRSMLAFRREESCQRGQWKLEADEWFMEWDVSRSLAELRAALLEETFMDD
jgi:flagellar biosynthesis/type III secretory pathway protein FliH